eukprot:EG_transcript_37859
MAAAPKVVSKTKALFWEKIPVAALPKTLWHLKGLSQAAMQTPVPSGTKAQLEDRFGKNRPNATKAAPGPKKAAQLYVLDRTREQNVGIVLSFLKLPLLEIRDALLSMDEAKLNADILAGLQSILPNAEELKAIAPWPAPVLIDNVPPGRER